MNDVKSGEKKRLYLYDNLKFLLIVLVVCFSYAIVFIHIRTVQQGA